MIKQFIIILIFISLISCRTVTTYYPPDGIHSLEERVETKSEGIMFSNGEGKVLDFKLIEINGLGV